MTNDELLDEVSASAEAALEAHASGDGSGDGLERKRDAARVALDAGHEVSAIAAAQTRGERAARERVGAQVLRGVERSARKVREATDEYERSVAKAVALGLPARDVAARAGVSHGTVAAIARRHEQGSAPPPDGATEYGSSESTSESVGGAAEAG